MREFDKSAVCFGNTFVLTLTTPVVNVEDVTFSSEAMPGVEYTDISDQAPVLHSGDYLYINEGYTGNQKISLAKLIPDVSDIGAGYILLGHSAYDNEGTLVTGTIPTYDGSYTVT